MNPYRYADEEPEMPKPEVLENVFGDRVFQKKFLEQRKIFLWGVVDDDSARYLVNRLLYLDAEKPGEEITFYINSPGGVVTSGMVIYDTMKMIQSPVSTICMGLAASMGSILLSAGTKGRRFIYPHGEVMIHQPSIGGYFQAKSIDLEIQARQIEKTKLIGAQILADNCGKTVEQIMKDFDRDYWMDANEALAYGIVDKVVDKI
ncbi:ATP-dependent Clp protease proteolytic subunit [Cytophagaceae bacterium DM2B3-1]|uniref:ATP-dependent Clp protease proteolytic subunit n=1 Tax=Xanthocytophaga flava TaxID=3048013 RepID=A0AAE3QXC0_9BACT|nr:ATP-dependent Clp protease proteolytic subunit [Xanthocytophaga flavus]MDJ1467113.1 ATP-dependent Clp protease proteolytic subunit [Xanthocytophaga flavus]MDJ1484885.1 ATP-dependent Clp protease proteolytic subunit [Xanthocytophaga flavus]MDJ1497391.1 ATP-dependent Clp protease proteolytic subunit [Xanthocytophaga flavus]